MLYQTEKYQMLSPTRSSENIAFDGWAEREATRGMKGTETCLRDRYPSSLAVIGTVDNSRRDSAPSQPRSS
jgi:hypothetical protein